MLSPYVWAISSTEIPEWKDARFSRLSEPGGATRGHEVVIIHIHGASVTRLSNIYTCAAHL